MFIKWLTGLRKGKKRRERAKVEIEELKKALLEDPKFRDEVLRELEYRTGRRDLLKAGVLGLLGITIGNTLINQVNAETTHKSQIINPEYIPNTNITDRGGFVITYNNGKYILNDIYGNHIDTNNNCNNLIRDHIKDEHSSTIYFVGSIKLNEKIRIPSNTNIYVKGTLENTNKHTPIFELDNTKNVTISFEGGGSLRDCGPNTIHIHNSKNVIINNAKIYSYQGWGIRVYKSANIVLSNITINSRGRYCDGIHLLDSSYIFISKIYGYTGDDFIAITAENKDVHDIIISEIICKGSNANGIRISQKVDSINRNQNASIYNIYLDECIIEHPKVNGITIYPIYSGTNIHDIHISCKIINPEKNGIHIGSLSGVPKLERLNIVCDIVKPTQHGIYLEDNIIVENCTISGIITRYNGKFNNMYIGSCKGLKIDVMSLYYSDENPQHNIHIVSGKDIIISGIIRGGLSGIQLGDKSKGVKNVIIHAIITDAKSPVNINKTSDKRSIKINCT